VPCCVHVGTISTAVEGTVEQDRRWSRAAVLRLVEEVKIRHHLLTDKITKNTAVWKDVAAAVSEELSGVSGAQCNQKWRNLKLQCKKFVDHSKTTLLQLLYKIKHHLLGNDRIQLKAC